MEMESIQLTATTKLSFKTLFQNLQLLSILFPHCTEYNKVKLRIIIMLGI
jgi:hypothetical protein